MKKEEAIQLFLKSCKSNNPSFLLKRKIAVETQYQRNVWELDAVSADIGKIRIQNLDTPKIILFYYIYAKVDGTQKNEYELTIDEYTILKNEYFGKFIEDLTYLKKLGS